MDKSNLTNEQLRWKLVVLAVAGLVLLALVMASGLGPAPTLAQAPAPGATATAAPDAAGAQAWIENPTDGQTLPLGPVRLVVYATDVEGVARIELRINGALLPAAAGGEQVIDPDRRLLRLDQQWTPDKEGKFILEARGVNAAGGYGEPDFVEFCVGACQRAVVVPTATPTLTPSPVPAKPTEEQPVPLQVTFTSDRTELLPGQCAILEWKVEGQAASIQLNGQEVPGFAKTEVCPRRTTKYTLVVTGANGEILAREITITVEQPDTPTPLPASPTPTALPAPVLQVTFTANTTNMVQGQCALLQWTVQGNPTMVTLNGQPVNPFGQSQVCPVQTTAYTLFATVAGGAPVERTVTITVQGITPPPMPPLPEAEIRLWADEDNVRAGSCTMIRWHVSGVRAYWVDGQPGMGDDGSRQVCPCEAETHTLHVVKADNSEQDFRVTIQVRGQCRGRIEMVTPTPTLIGPIHIAPGLLR